MGLGWGDWGQYLSAVESFLCWRKLPELAALSLTLFALFAPQTLSHSLRMADQSFEKLKDESDRLEQHAKKSVDWLLWIMLIVVCFIFISMILFIRIFPKLK